SLSLSEGVVSRIQGFQKLLDGFRAKLGTMPIADLVRALLDAIEYRAELERVYTGPGEAESRWLAIEELVNAAALYEQRTDAPSLLGFLEEAALADRDDKDQESGRERHAVTLMTLHSAKGLEFPHVYMVGVEEGILPHQRSVLEGRGVEEERRLCYVGVTRAQETLTLTFTKARMKWGKPRPSIPSRFLMEMRGETERARRAAEAAMALFGSAVQGRPRGSGTESETEGAGKRSTKASRKTRDTKRKRSASG